MHILTESISKVKKYLNPTTKTICAYLLAIILANNAVTYFGAIGLWITGFFLIPFDLLARDILHEKWRGNNLALKMHNLILLGGILSFATNPSTMLISVAGFCAFASAGATNTLFYYLFDNKTKFIKMNVSNFFASIVDTLVFLSIANIPSDNLFKLFVIQVLIKFLGGMLWSVTYIRLWKKDSLS